jgi:WD40 repeat protein
MNSHAPELPTEAWKRLEQILQRFENAWQSGERPDLDDYLREADSEQRQTLLIELVQEDLEYRLKAGEAARVEDYLKRYPERAGDRAVVLELVTAEYAMRCRRESGCAAEEYLRRFPDYREELLARLQPPRVPDSEDQTLPPRVMPGLAGEASSDGTLPESSPTADRPTVPGYEIEEELGRGGMGVVYRARQLSLNRLVALKMILAGAHASEEDLARFRTEAEAVAHLQHPNIVQIHEIGERAGLPFFSLEFVDGGSLASQLDGTPWPALPAAQLVQTLAEAMHYAHQRGIIHRDLKPGNVLLASGGCKPPEASPGGLHPPLADLQPKITDFGLAKQLGSDKGQTASGAIMGTPSYMAPEQAGGHSKEIGPAADTYALGAILYELLTGRPPFKAATAMDTLLQVVAEEPVPLRRLHSKIPKDLETICLKCLEKKPAKRYASAHELAEELARFQQGEPIRARPITAPARLWRWCLRRPLVASLAATVAALLLFAAVAGPWIAHRQASLQAQAEAQDREAQRAKEMVEQAAAQSIALAHGEWLDNNVKGAEALLERCPDRFRGWEWHYLTGLCHAELLTLRGHSVAAINAMFSPDGRRIFSAGADGALLTWDAATGQQLGKAALKVQGQAHFSGEGRWAATDSGDGLRDILIWDLAANQPHRTLHGHTEGAAGGAFSPDGRLYASGSLDKTVKIWDLDTAECLLTLRGHSEGITAAGFSPDGKYLASGDLDGGIKIWDATTGQELHTLRGHLNGPLMLINQLVFSPDGSRLASASNDGTVKVWDKATGQEMLALRGHIGFVYGVDWSPDGKRLATSAWDQTLGVWDATTGQRLLTLRGHTWAVKSVHFSSDGTRLVSAGIDQMVKVWDATALQEYADLRGHTAPVPSVAFSPDGRTLASASWDKTVKIWEVATHREVLTFRGHDQEVSVVAYSPDGKRIVSATGGVFSAKPGEARIWDAATGKELATLRGHRGPIACIAFSSDGQRIASATGSAGSPRLAEIKLWDAASGKEIRDLQGHKGGIFGLAFNPDGSRLASASIDGTVRVWDATTGEVVQTFQAGMGGIFRGLAFSPDGQRLASARGNGSGVEPVVYVWDLQTGKEAFALRGHTHEVYCLTFSPDGKRLATTGHDATIKIWDTATGQDLLTLRGHRHEIYSVVFSPDGNLLASSSFDTTVKLWDARLPAPAKTDDWPVIFTDEFNRAQPGESWETVNGTWSIEKGVLRGEMHQAPDFAAGINSAGIRLRSPRMPSTVEMRINCWSPDAVIVSGAVQNDANTQTQGGMLMGTPNPSLAAGGRGTAIALQTDKMIYHVPAASSKVELKPNTHYHMRILREPQRLTVFIDGVEIVSAPVPDMDLPRLALGGGWGKTNAVVYFDNLQVRAPVAAIQEREAHDRVEALFEQWRLRDDVLAQLRGDATLSDAVRERALRLAEKHGEDGRRLQEGAFHLVGKPDGKPADYIQGLRWAEGACRLVPDNWLYLATLGTAQYRNDRCREAVDTLRRSIELSRSAIGSAIPLQLTYLALAHHRLRQEDEARDTFIGLRDLMKGSSWSDKDFARDFYHEAEKVLGGLLPNDAPGHEKEAIKDLVIKAIYTGWTQHDLAGYLAYYTDDVRVSGGARVEEEGPQDFVLDRRQLEAVRKLQFAGPPSTATSAYEDMQVDLNGNQAVLRCRGTVEWDGGFMTFGARYRLRRTAGGWKIFDDRGWLLRSKIGARTYANDPDTLRSLDARVAALRNGESRRALIRALQYAGRPKEAHAEARALTQQPLGAPAEDWGLRGELAVEAGDAADALKSYHNALTLEPETMPPPFLNRERLTLRGHEGPVFGVDFNPDGTRIVSCGNDGTVKIWDAQNGQLLQTYKCHETRISGVAWSPDGKHLATASLDHTARVWDAATGKEVAKLSGHTEAVYRVAFESPGWRVITASADGTARVWNPRSGQELRKLEGHKGPVLGAVFRPKGSGIATASHDRTAILWDVFKGEGTEILQGHKAELIRVAFSPDGKHLATAGADGKVKVWDMETFMEERELSGHTALVETVAWSPDGQLLASAGADRTIKVWDAANGRKLLSLRGHEGRIFALAFTPDSKRLASACEDGTVRIWDVTGVE